MLFGSLSEFLSIREALYNIKIICSWIRAEYTLPNVEIKPALLRANTPAKEMIYTPASLLYFCIVSSYREDLMSLFTWKPYDGHRFPCLLPSRLGSLHFRLPRSECTTGGTHRPETQKWIRRRETNLRFEPNLQHPRGKRKGIKMVFHYKYLCSLYSCWYSEYWANALYDGPPQLTVSNWTATVPIWAAL